MIMNTHLFGQLQRQLCQRIKYAVIESSCRMVSPGIAYGPRRRAIETWDEAMLAMQNDAVRIYAY